MEPLQVLGYAAVGRLYLDQELQKYIWNKYGLKMEGNTLYGSDNEFLRVIAEIIAHFLEFPDGYDQKHPDFNLQFRQYCPWRGYSFGLYSLMNREIVRKKVLKEDFLPNYPDEEYEDCKYTYHVFQVEMKDKSIYDYNEYELYQKPSEVIEDLAKIGAQ